MRPLLSIAPILLFSLVGTAAFAADVHVDPTLGQAAISPYVYGVNQVGTSTVPFTSLRQGGNRLTGYNWENNYSNAGTDWENSSDTYLCDAPSVCASPGATMTTFVDGAKKNSAYALLTLQMAGYVATDDNGAVAASEVAPSSRWKKVAPRKGSAFLTTPNTTDDTVYMDELVNFLVQRYGKASDGGVPGYSLDNEPDLWSGTHPLIHPDGVGAVELIERSVALATAVKAVDPSADVFGFVSYGFMGFVNLQDAADWAQIKGNYEWYVQYFLAQMAAASKTAGVRLLDVLDLHYYSEAVGGGTRVQSGTTANAAARVQSTRSLWDSTYGYSETDPTVGENSWVTQWNDPVELIPRVKRYISTLYPDTKLALTEYDFGAADHVSGGVAQADALGIFGKEGVYFASRWGTPGTYTDAAFRLFLDYDGTGSGYGDVSVQATTSDVANVPVYAAIDQTNPKLLHVILINRNLSAAQTAKVTIDGSSSYGSGHAWGFDSTGSTLTDRGAVAVSSNSFSLSLPALSAFHVTLSTDDPPDITGVGGSGGTAGTTTPGGGTVGYNPGGGTAGTNTADASAGASAEAVEGKKGDSGCGCRIVQPSGSASIVSVGIGALALLLRRRRSR